jgi:hypothetical protein
MLGALIGSVFALVGLIVGWFVGGTQRVNEDLTRERRAAFAEVLIAANRRRWEIFGDPAEASPRQAIPVPKSGADPTESSQGKPGPASLAEAVARAQFLATAELRDTKVLLALYDRARHDSVTDWFTTMDEFVALARLEAQGNSRTLRRCKPASKRYDAAKKRFEMWKHDERTRQGS